MTVQLQKMKMLVAGEWKDSATGARSSILDPSSGEIIAEVPRATKQDAKAAVDAARDAFGSPEWRGIGSRERGGVFSKASGVGRVESGEFGGVGTCNEGEKLRETQGGGVWGGVAVGGFVG